MNRIGVANHITQWLKEYSENSGTKGFVVGISGGIDSALTSTLAARTGKPTLCLEMPIHQAESQVTRAQNHIEWLQKEFPNVSKVNIDLTSVYEEFKSTLPSTSSENKDISLVNARARLRMTTLYYFAQLHGYLVAGTGNKVEDFGVGFYTKYGDGGVDLSPIADLMKSEVFALAGALGVNQDILDAAPTDGLWGDNRTDEDQIGATYPELEWAMHFIDNGEEGETTDRQKEVLKIYKRLNSANKHKMVPIPVCVIPEELRPVIG
ncbi:MAG: NAD(+) synthase [Flavobacteriales bacterium]|nr:NAD(+) synthase [Flavobacteriales bacterium]